MCEPFLIQQIPSCHQIPHSQSGKTSIIKSKHDIKGKQDKERCVAQTRKKSSNTSQSPDNNSYG